MSVENGLAEQQKFSVEESRVKINKAQQPMPEPCVSVDQSGKGKPAQKKSGNKY